MLKLGYTNEFCGTYNVTQEIIILVEFFPMTQILHCC